MKECGKLYERKKLKVNLSKRTRMLCTRDGGLGSAEIILVDEVLDRQ